MPTLDKSNFNIVCATLGGFITLFGLVSYLCKETLFLSEALISLIAGVTFSPHAIGLIKPLDYAQGSQEDLDNITHYFTRLVLGVQLVLAGVQLPSKYLLREWRPLAWLLGPGMTGMWICSSLLVWALVPRLTILPALAVGACVTPTDPVLSNSIVKGRFADKNVPRALQQVIIAESGANDGLGYPFLFIALYLMKYTGEGGAGQDGGAGLAIGLWVGETLAYEILLGTVYGAVVGYLAKELLHWAEEHRYVDRESFLVFAITLALFIVGTCGMIGSDDVLACFVAGNAFTLDDWFRLETLDDSLQPTIDMLLNLSVFMWFGAVCPWASFASNDVVPLYRLVPLGVLVLLLRRLPVVLAMHRRIHQIEELQQALFVGFFGPIGVSAVFYLFVSLQFLDEVTLPDGSIRSDAAQLQDVMRVVVWFLAICSIVVHGMSVPLGKLGYHLPRTISSALESRESRDRPDDTSTAPFRIGDPVASFGTNGASSSAAAPRSGPPASRARRNHLEEPERHVFRIGGSAIPAPLGTPILRNVNASPASPASPSAPSPVPSATPPIKEEALKPAGVDGHESGVEDIEKAPASSGSGTSSDSKQPASRDGEVGVVRSFGPEISVAEPPAAADAKRA